MFDLNDSITWYNQHAKHYAHQAEKYIPQDQIEDFVRLLPKESKVLDAGCGSGRDCRVLQSKGIQMTGIDLSEELLRIAQSQNPGITFVKGNLEQLPFPDQSFDGLWSHASLVHLPTMDDTRVVIQEFLRVLKPGGILHIYTQASSTGSDEYVNVHNEGETTGRDFHKYTKEELMGVLAQTGFTAIKCDQFVDPFYKEKGGPKIEWILYLGKKYS